MSKHHGVTLLEEYLKPNDWMILSVGHHDRSAYQDRFCTGQTIHNNQDAVIELAEFGYFPGGTIFAFKPRLRRKGKGKNPIAFAEVDGGTLVDREFALICHQVDWCRVVGIIHQRLSWMKKISEHHLIEKEMEEMMGIEFDFFCGLKRRDDFIR